LYNGRKIDVELQALNAALHLLSPWIILQSTTYSENNPYTSVYSGKNIMVCPIAYGDHKKLGSATLSRLLGYSSQLITWLLLIKLNIVLNK